MDKREFRELIKSHGIRQWEVAAQMGYSEWSLSRILRYPLKPEMEAKILKAVDEIAKEKEK
jgi:hypothetical protein